MRNYIWWIGWLLAVVYGGVCQADALPYSWLVDCSLQAESTIPAGQCPYGDPTDYSWECHVYQLVLANDQDYPTSGACWSILVDVSDATGLVGGGGKVGLGAVYYVSDWCDLADGVIPVYDVQGAVDTYFEVLGYATGASSEGISTFGDIGGAPVSDDPYDPPDDWADDNNDGYDDHSGWPMTPPAWWLPELPWPPPFAPWDIPEDPPEYWPPEESWPGSGGWPDMGVPSVPPMDWPSDYPWPPDGWPPTDPDDPTPILPPDIADPIIPPELVPLDPPEDISDPTEPEVPEVPPDEIVDDPDTWLDESLFGEKFNVLADALEAKLGLMTFGQLWETEGAGIGSVSIPMPELGGVGGQIIVIDFVALADSWWVVIMRTMVLIVFCISFVRGVLITVRQY